jgi:hypothetical protein
LVGKSDRDRDLRERQLGHGEKPPDATDASLEHELVRRHAGGLLECPREMARRQADEFRQHDIADVFRQMGQDVLRTRRNARGGKPPRAGRRMPASSATSSEPAMTIPPSGGFDWVVRLSTRESMVPLLSPARLIRLRATYAGTRGAPPKFRLTSALPMVQRHLGYDGV